MEIHVFESISSNEDVSNKVFQRVLPVCQPKKHIIVFHLSFHFHSENSNCVQALLGSHSLKFSFFFFLAILTGDNVQQESQWANACFIWL